MAFRIPEAIRESVIHVTVDSTNLYTNEQEDKVTYRNGKERKVCLVPAPFLVSHAIEDRLYLDRDKDMTRNSSTN